MLDALKDMKMELKNINTDDIKKELEGVKEELKKTREELKKNKKTVTV
jgi:predicted ATP-grasp superfamily ATP-dependent carboligase